MKFIFKNRWISSFLITVLAAAVSLLFTGTVDLTVLIVVFILSAVATSYPSWAERRWQSQHLPPDAIHVPVRQIQKGREYQLLQIFDLPDVYQPLKNRYSLKSSDAGAPGLFLYIYLPLSLYQSRNAGPDAVYQYIAAKLKRDLEDPQNLDLIAQRYLPLAFGFRFLPKQDFPYHDLSQVIDIVKKEYFRENTRIKGVLQSKQRLFRMHAPEDNEWRRFQPYQEESLLLYGGDSISHDFRSAFSRRLRLQEVSNIDAERVEYPEKIAFGALLTYAKKGEITLQGSPDAVDKLYIDRVNVLVQGSEHRKEILREISKQLKREIGEDDFYPLFNYGQRLRGYVSGGKSLSDCVSSHGNFALYYDNDKGWTILKLEPRLELRLVEAYWSTEPKAVNSSTSLTTSRATLISGAPDSLLHFEISTGTPTRGQIFAADEMIEGKMKTFADVHGFRLLNTIGSGAEGCLYLAEKSKRKYYLKSPDGQLAQEEMETVETLKKRGLIPKEIRTYPEDRMLVMPEYKSMPAKSNGDLTPLALLFGYLKTVWDNGYICLDLTPDHVKMDPENEKLFLIDFSGYVQTEKFRKQPKEYLEDRKKIEYRTPEESATDFGDAEKFQIYLIGLLFYQLTQNSLPFALKTLGNGTGNYARQLAEDLKSTSAQLPLSSMLAFDPNERKTFEQLTELFNVPPEQIHNFWKRVRNE